MRFTWLHPDGKWDYCLKEIVHVTYFPLFMRHPRHTAQLKQSSGLYCVFLCDALTCHDVHVGQVGSVLLWALLLYSSPQQQQHFQHI
jgi:hypothetical protein